MVRHLFVINPNAGEKNRYPELSQAIKTLDIDGKVYIEKTEYCGHASEIVREYLKKDDSFLRVYSCGGDGTLSEIICGVHSSENKNCAIGVVPIGSGNDFIKYFSDYTKESFLDIQKMAQGDFVSSDVIEVDDGEKNAVSINIVSVGYDCAVAKGMQKYKRIPLIKKLAYECSVVECLVSKMKHRFRLIVDDVEVEDGKNDYLFTIAANGSYYGGGFKASPKSDLNDGLMDIIRIKTVSRLKFAKLVGKFRQGEHLGFKDIVDWQKAKKLQILSDKTIDVNIDGEIIPMKNPVVRIIDSAVKVILPAKIKTAATV